MWFLPTWGRPEALLKLADAPGGWPHGVMLLINEGDPLREDYERLPLVAAHSRGWKASLVPGNGRVCDAWRFAFEQFPNEPFYGVLCDDFWPETPNWWMELQKDAGKHDIAYAWGQEGWPRIRSAVCFGGDLVRAMGGLAPPGFKHNYLDDVWERIGLDFGLLKPREDIRVLHRHWLNDRLVVKDETYQRGSHDIESDRATFERWLASKERHDLNVRVAAMLGGRVRQVETSKIRLGICYATREQPDRAFNRSLRQTEALLKQSGISHVIFETSGGSDVEKARPLWRAMLHPVGITHLLFIDDDMGWDPQLVLSMLLKDKEFVAAVGVKKQDGPPVFCFNQLPNPQRIEDGLLEVKECGFAFVLLKRAVIEKLCAAYPELQYKTGDGSAQFALFLHMLDYTNPDDELPDYMPEDYSFCRRWRKIGGQIWVDPTAALIHAGRKEYSGALIDVIEFPEPLQEAAE